MGGCAATCCATGRSGGGVTARGDGGPLGVDGIGLGSSLGTGTGLGGAGLEEEGSGLTGASVGGRDVGATTGAGTDTSLPAMDGRTTGGTKRCAVELSHASAAKCVRLMNSNGAARATSVVRSGADVGIGQIGRAHV